MIGTMYLTGEGMEQPGYNEAEKWLRGAAAKDIELAEPQLGMMYMNGLSINQNLDKAKEYFKLVADKGNLIAQTNLGAIYAYDVGLVDMLFNLNNNYDKGDIDLWTLTKNDSNLMEVIKYIRIAAE